MSGRLGRPAKLCDRPSRREAILAGGLSLFGSISLPRLLAAKALAKGVDSKRPAAKSIILLNLYGGPSHIDMFDMKPDAPVEVRGEFRPIASRLAGVSVCEHLPKLAGWMDRGTLIRSVTHEYNSHNPYALLTGYTGGDDRENYYTKRTDHPGISAVCQYLGLGPADLPGSIFLPALPGYSQGLRRAGPYGGYLGKQFDPIFADCSPKFDKEFDQLKSFYDPVAPYGEPNLPSVESIPELTIGRLQGRNQLLQAIDQQVANFETSRESLLMGHYQRKALDLLTSSRARAAFDLSKEPERTRALYGKSLFGTSLLVARRLSGAGVPFVCVTTESRGAGHWDSHEKNFSMLKDFNLPNLDEIASALLNDLDQQGKLSETLVVIMGEMGRAPRVNGKAGRDHWPKCGFALLFGGGVKQGFVLGASDKFGAYPVDQPVSPGDILATMYQQLGLDSQLIVKDLEGRPFLVTHGGKPILDILG